MRPSPTRWSTAVVVLALVALLGACTADEPAPEPGPEPGSTSSEASPSGSPSSSTGSSTGSAAAEPGGTAEAYAVPADAQPVPLEDLGTLQTDAWTFTVNGLRRTGGQAVMLTGTMERGTGTTFTGFEEEGFSLRDTPDGLASTYEFSAVTLTVPGDPASYKVMRDETGLCTCSQDVRNPEGDSFAVYALLTAPEDATTADITVAGLGTVPGVEIVAT